VKQNNNQTAVKTCSHILNAVERAQKEEITENYNIYNIEA